MKPDPKNYLGRYEVIDFDSRNVAELARRLATRDVAATAKACFEFVRDEIRHSSDYELNPVTCSASQVLAHKTGYCYAKSHLLCALLRANRIPAGLCYQRLSIDDIGAPYCLHGLNAVFLPAHGWYRMDARGNNEKVDAQFEPPVERLAFTTDLVGEQDIPGIFVEPLPEVQAVLEKYTTWDAVAANLPDWEHGC